MARIKINSDEKLAMRGEQHHVRIIYEAIRWKMDFKTGIAGGIRGVNIMDALYFHEELRVDPIPGRSKSKLKKYSRQEIRSAIERLEKKGVIKDLGDFVFECLLADRDDPKQNSSNPATTKATTISSTNKKNNKLLKNKEKLEEKNVATTGAEPSGYSSSNPPPESGNIPLDTNIEINNSLPIQTLSNSQKTRISTDCLEILNYLRMKTSKNFGKDEHHIAEITARLKDKSPPSVEDCKLVIDCMWDRWCEDDKMRDHANPTTLFRKRNFYRYLGYAKESGGDNGESSLKILIARAEKGKAELEESFQRACEEYNALRLRR